MEKKKKTYLRQILYLERKICKFLASALRVNKSLYSQVLVSVVFCNGVMMTFYKEVGVTVALVANSTLFPLYTLFPMGPGQELVHLIGNRVPFQTRSI